jgi:N-acetylmuramoyl-L-alanine amidase
MEIQNHRLSGEGIKFVESPNHEGEIKPDSIVIHYTGGSSLESSVRTLTDESNPQGRVSAHLVIGQKGEIVQLVPFNIKAWHAGPSSYNGRSGFNNFSIGIEIDNAGMLTKSGNLYTSWFGRAYPEEKVIKAVHRNGTEPKYWHRFTEEQITTVEELCRLLVIEYDIKMILGHEEISPRRKVDPGPAFPLDKLRDKILKADRDRDEAETVEFPLKGVVTASSLNIRADDSGVGEKVGRPLVKGTKVDILGESNGWYKVNVQIEGWVSGKYVDTQK